MIHELLCRTYAFLFANRACRPLNSLLLACSLRGLGIQNWHSPAASGERWFLRRYLPRVANPTVIDVGAHRGDYTAMCLEFAPHARILACEPHPLSLAELRRRFSDCSNVSLCETAIAANTGCRSFYDRASEQGTSHASLHRAVIEDLHICEAAEFAVQVTTLDEIATRHSIGNIDLLKIDTEGSELDVLKGAVGLLRENRIAVCQIEFNAMNVYSRVFFKDFWDVLTDFHLFRLLPGGLLPITAYNPLYAEIFAYQNIIAVSRHHNERLRILEGS